MKIGIIGAGAYGCYAVNVLQKKYPNCEITLFDVGDNNIRNEDEIGFKSNVKEGKYSGLSKGRFFGHGGSTAKWGGQLLTFTKNDFKDAKGILKDIVLLNEKYHKEVYSEFNIEFNYSEPKITDDFHLKTGVWLGYFNRNLFKYFKIQKRDHVKVVSSARIINFISQNEKTIGKVIYLKNGKTMEASFDYYFLTAGAFESSRLLLKSALINENSLKFSDHLSRKAFKVHGDAKIGDVDFSFRVKGTSIITRRLIGEIDGVSYYVHPVFNSNFPFFSNLKKLLFKREFSILMLKSVFGDIPSLVKFIYSLIFLRKIYVHKNEWFLYIDIENPKNASSFQLSTDVDGFEQEVLDVDFKIGEDTRRIYDKIKQKLLDYLVSNHIEFEECDAEIHIDKLEDTYHPYGMISDFASIKDYYRQYDNLVVFNTGLLPRAGGINVTAAVFPLIEEYVNNYIV